MTDLTALLDALELELLATSAAEVRDAQRETGRAWEAACHEIRSLLNEAVAAADDAAPAPISVEAANNRQWH